MHIIAVYIVGRQFPDKAIDLIDEACNTAAKRMVQIGKQENHITLC
jgi:ATP-dependent Clp protease ATP-binding subunit ClpA